MDMVKKSWILKKIQGEHKKKFTGEKVRITKEIFNSGMVGKGLKRQRSYPAVAGSSPPHAMVTVVLNSSPEL